MTTNQTPANSADFDKAKYNMCRESAALLSDDLLRRLEPFTTTVEGKKALDDEIKSRGH